jgi:hypothetical protein
MEEVDMPPPNYRGVFPSEPSGSVVHDAELGSPTRAQMPDLPPENPDTSNGHQTTNQQPEYSFSGTVVSPSKREQIVRRIGGVNVTSVITPPRRFKGRRG